MPLVPVMWAVWVALVLIFIVLKLYVGRLSRDEDDQLVLDDSFQHIRDEQAAISARLSRMQPVMLTSTVLLSAMTLFVIGYYIFDMVRQFQ